MLYGVPTVPFAPEGNVSFKSGGAAMLMLPLALAVCWGFEESVTVNVTAAAGPLLTVVGVPVIAPVEVFSDSPAGNVPAVSANVYGGVPPEGFSVTLYGVPTVPF